MKKLKLFALVLMLAIASLNAQNSQNLLQRAPQNPILETDFSGTTGHSLPSGWTRSPEPPATVAPGQVLDPQTWVTSSDLLGQPGFTPLSGDRVVGVMTRSDHLVDDVNAWLFSPAMNLTEGQTYVLTFVVWAHGRANPFEVDHFRVMIGEVPTEVGMASADVLYLNTDVQIRSWARVTVPYVATRTGVHHLAFHVFTPAGTGFFVAMDQMSFAPMLDNDLAIINGLYPLTQVPVSQTMLPTISATIENIGVFPQTNVTLSATFNDVLVGISEPLPTIAPRATEVLSITTANNPILLGNNTLTFTVDQTETDEDPTDNIVTSTIVGTENTFAADDGTRMFQTSIGLNGVSIGNIFPVTQPIIVNAVSAAFSNRTSTSPVPINVVIFQMDANNRPEANPILRVPANVPVEPGWHNFDIPPTILQPGRYFVALETTRANDSLEINSDGNPGRNSYMRFTALFNTLDEFFGDFIDAPRGAVNLRMHTAIPTGDATFEGLTTLAVGNVFNNLPQTVALYRIINSGSEPLTVNVVSSSAGITISPSTMVLNALEERVLTVTIASQGLSAGAFSGNFTLSTNDPANATVDVAVTGAVVSTAVVSQFIFEDFDITPIAANRWTIVGNNITRQASGGINNSPALRLQNNGSAASLPALLESFVTTNFVYMGDNPVFSFWYRVTEQNAFAAAPAEDVQGSVSISTDNGNTWTEIWTLARGAHIPSIDYALVSVDVSEFANQHVQIRFWFRAFPVGETGAAAAYQRHTWIDNVTIGTIPNTPIFGVPATPFAMGGTLAAPPLIPNNIPMPVSRTFPIKNMGGAPLTVTSIVSSTGDRITAPELPVTVQPFETGVFTIFFDAQGLPGGIAPATAPTIWAGSPTIVLATNDTAQPQVTIPITASISQGVRSNFIRENFNAPNGAVGNLPQGWSGLPSQGAGGFQRQNAGGRDNTPALGGSVINTRLMIGAQTNHIDAGTAPILSFWYNAVIATGSQVGASGENLSVRAYVTRDNGVTWNRVFTSDPSVDHSFEFRQVVINLPEYANDTLIQARIEFVSAEDPARSGGTVRNAFEAHIRLDDVIFGTHPYNELEALTLTGTTQPTVGTPFRYTVTLRNTGLLTQDHETYQVKLMKVRDAAAGGDTAVVIVPGVEVAADDTVAITFDWIPHVAGPAQIFAVVSLPTNTGAMDTTTNIMNINVLPEGDFNLVVGTGTNTDNRIPIHTNARKSLGQTIYLPHEIGAVGVEITRLTYHMTSTAASASQRVTVFMGETDLPNLTPGVWINPAVLTRVFDGMVDFTVGTAMPVVIELETPYVYTGRNLVIYMYKWDSPAMGTGRNFIGTEVGATVHRSRQVNSNANPGIEFNYMTPWAFTPEGWPGTIPMTTFVPFIPNVVLGLNVEGFGRISGVVTDGTNPLEGVEVRLFGATTFTDADGRYEFLNVAVGNYEIRASMHRFRVQTDSIVMTKNAVITKNFVMEYHPTYAISGTVIASDTELPLEGVTLTLTGYETYETLTDVDGFFEFPAVFAPGEYTLTATGISGYQTYTATINVVIGVGNIVHNITLLENAYMPNELIATVVGNNVELSWTTPGTPYDKTIILDGGVPSEIDLAWRARAMEGFALGNRFVVTEGGEITSVDIYAMYCDLATTRPIRVVIYDENRDSIGASELIILEGDAWTNIPLPNITYTGAFYAMVHWYAQAGVTNWLVQSNQGPAEHRGAAHIFQDGNWGYWHVANPGAGRGVFLIRANVTTDGYNIGAPMAAPANAPGSFTGEYVLYRFTEGQPRNEWTLLANDITTTTFIDTDWYDLPWGVYQWAILARYANNVLSNPRLSNTIDKDMTVSFTINIVANNEVDITGATVVLTNQNGDPNHVYTLVAGATGVTFPAIWRGVYDLEVTLFGFETYVYTLTITETGSHNVVLTEIPFPVVNLTATLSGQDVVITWDAPLPTTTYIMDDGIAQNGVRFLPGPAISAGNRYVVSDAGYITSVDIFTRPFAGSNNSEVRVNVFNAERNLVGQSEMFVLPGNNAWMNVPLIERAPFSGIFYVMVYWPDTETGHTNFVGYNETGPVEYRNSNVMISGANWVVPFHGSVGLNPGVLMIRPNADVTGDAPTTTIAYQAPQVQPAVFAINNFEKASTQVSAFESFVTRTSTPQRAVQQITQNTVVEYAVYRLLQGADRGDWVPIATVTNATEFIDENFLSLPVGTYQWAVVAVYRDDVSEARLTNAISNQTFTITASVGGGNGVIDPSGSIPVVRYESQTFTFTPAEGYEISQVLINGTNNAGAVTAGTHTFTNVTSDHTIVVSFSQVTSIGDIITADMFTVFPNPVRDELHIETDQAILRLELIDMSGRTVQTWIGDRRTIDVSTIPTGTYILQIHTENAIVPIRIVKQ